MTKRLPSYIVNSLYGYTDKQLDPTRDDFLFLTYKEGLNKETKMRITRETNVEFYVTKEGLQNQNVKKQTEKLCNLDGYSCRQKDLTRELAKALKIYGKWHSLADLSKNLYVYGADISCEYHIREKYNQEAKQDSVAHGMPPTIPYSLLNRGGFDIETSVLGKNEELKVTRNEIILLTLVDADYNIWTTIYKPFLRNAKMIDVVEHVNKALGIDYTDDNNKIKKYGLNINLHVSDTEVGCIRWIFDRIHESGLDFISIWNMGFDIPRIIERLEYHGENPADYFCHPKIPPKYKYFKYKTGKTRPSEHFAEKWDWCFNAAIHQFYDSMATFAKIRKVDGHENSYSLTYITEKYVDESKLFADEPSTHHIMQSERFLDYIAYNIWDAVLLVVLEKKMNHVHNLIGLSQSNPLSIFNKNTTQCKNDYFTYCKTQGEIVCTVVGDAFDTDNEIDDMPALGGAVLDPNLAIETGVDFITDSRRTFRVHRKNKDEDAEAMYPSIGQAINDSRDSVIYTLLAIDSDPSLVEDFCTNYIDTQENSVYLLNKYFNLPDYSGMVQEYKKEKI